MAEPVNDNDKNFAVLTHLGGIFFSVIPGLVVWLLKKDDSPYLADQAREALNFQISVLLAYMLSYVLMIVLIGFALVAVVWITNIILCIIAAVSASRGESYRYPFSLRLIN